MLWQDKLDQNTRVLTNGYIQRTSGLSEREKKKGNIPCIELFDRRSPLIILNPPDVRAYFCPNGHH